MLSLSVRLPALLAVLALVVAIAVGHNGDEGASGEPGPSPPAVRSSNCGQLDGADQVNLDLSRTPVDRPSERIPFFARQAGALPRDGAPTIAGIKLPRGSRCMRHWATDVPVAEPFALADRLAKAFPRTGLWPMLWSAFGDDPDAYHAPRTDLAAVDRVDPAVVLRRAWARYADSPFPGLAPSPGAVGAGPASASPFVRYQLSLTPETWDEAGFSLVLLPLNRPADALSVIGAADLGNVRDVGRTAILRSWEERFGAVLVASGPDNFSLVIDSPPRSKSQALKLAAEWAAFSPGDADYDGRGKPALRELADAIRTDRISNPDHARARWTIWYYTD